MASRLRIVIDIADQNKNLKPDVQVSVEGEAFGFKLPPFNGPVIDISPDDILKQLQPVLSKVPGLPLLR